MKKILKKFTAILAVTVVIISMALPASAVSVKKKKGQRNAYTTPIKEYYVVFGGTNNSSSTGKMDVKQWYTSSSGKDVNETWIWLNPGKTWNNLKSTSASTRLWYWLQLTEGGATALKTSGEGYMK